MNDEIKETLEYKIDFLTKSLNIGIPTKNRRYFNDIKDYITNLQQAFERSYTEEQVDFAVNEVKEQLKIEKQYSNQLCNEIDKLRVKNYELQQIEQDHKEANATLMSELAKLEEENKRLKENAIHNDKVVDKAKWNEMIYKSRCEKAIEYIKENQDMVEWIHIPAWELLNILQNGSDDNDNWKND